MLLYMWTSGIYLPAGFVLMDSFFFNRSRIIPSWRAVRKMPWMYV